MARLRGGRVTIEWCAVRVTEPWWTERKKVGIERGSKAVEASHLHATTRMQATVKDGGGRLTTKAADGWLLSAVPTV